MFSKTLFFIISFLTLLVAATTTTITEHPPVPSPTNSVTCSQVGFTPVCCAAVIDEVAAPLPSLILGLLTIVITPGTGLLGINCVPLGEVCAGYVLCCENVGPLISTGCVNILH